MISTGSRTLIAHAITDNVCKVINRMTKQSPYPGAGTNDLQGAWFYYTGSKFALYNGVYCDKRIENNIDQHFTDTLEFFAERNVPFMWWWRQSGPVPESIRQVLGANGFEALNAYTGMAVRLDTMSPVVLPSRTRLKEVISTEDYIHWAAIAGEVFYFSDNVRADYFSMFRLQGLHSAFKHYIAYYADEPAAAITSYVDNDVVGLYNFATLPKMQNKGLCTALMHYALQEAKAHGCKLAVSQLMASDQGASNLERLGFTRYSQLLPFVKNW